MHMARRRSPRASSTFGGRLRRGLSTDSGFRRSYLTGIAFVLAGIAILSRIQDVLAAKLLALMLLIFSALVLAPMIVAAPHAQGAWAANAYNLTAVGAAWILAEYLPALKFACSKDRSHAPLAS
jgi:hypothetical protein